MARVTDDERRRAAAERLRGLNGNVSHVRRVYEDEGFSILCDDQADYYQICHSVAGYLPAEHMHPCDYEELHARLADLIDPDSHPDLGTQKVDASQVPKCDREALLALAEELANVRRWSCYTDDDLLDIAERIREACGVVS